MAACRHQRSHAHPYTTSEPENEERSGAYHHLYRRTRFGGHLTIAKDYAITLAAETGQKVLLIEAGPGERDYQASEGLVDAGLKNSSPVQAIHSTKQNISTARWLANEENRSNAGQVIHNVTFWSALLDVFDSIIIDAPSLQHSFEGVTLATKADATVLVIQAESTPEPVINNLRDTLNAAGAKLSGIVMNKRQYHIPAKIYKRL